MAEYIKREAVLNRLRKLDRLCASFIEKMPYTEAEPVRHGHNTGNARIFECSECGYGYDDIYLTDEHHFDPEEINYCPNCGCKIDKPDNT